MTRRREEPPSHTAVDGRREFLKLAAATAAFGPSFLFPDRSSASQKILKIARWPHFLPEYDAWFEGVYAKQWGSQHDTKVVVDRIPIDKINACAAAEAATGKGHDLFMFPWPPADFRRHAIDHTEVYQAVGSRHGTVNRIGHRSTFDPKTNRYFAFADSWMPAPLHYFEDYWKEANIPLGPVHYGDLRGGGKIIRAKMGVPCGLAIGPSLEGNITLHTLLYAFRSGVLDADGNVTLNRSYGTINALKYVKALYDEAGAAQQLTWGPSDNSRAALARKTSCTINAISLLRSAEKQDHEVASHMMVSPPLLGPAGVMAVPHVTSCSVVWTFAENKEGAKEFLADMIDSFKSVYEKSQGCNFPTYQNTVPDLIRRLENDAKAEPSFKYFRLKDALHWTANLGFPGYATPVAMEAFNSFVIPRMFISVVKGELSPEDAARRADTEVQRIAEKWSRIW